MNENVVYFNLVELKDLPDTRGKAHYYAKCSFCKRDMNILYLENSLKPYETSEQYQTVASFECRYYRIKVNDD